MAILFDGPVSPDALTTFVREVPTPAEFVLNQLLPDRYPRTNTVDLNELTRTNRTARFRAYDGRLHVSERDTSTTKQVKLPPLSTSYSMGEYERLQEEFARTQGTNQAALVNAVYDDATNGTREIQARMEQARGDVLTDGKFTLTGEGGLFLEADFGIPAAHLVAPAIPWSTVATATVIQNLRTWVDVFIATNGFPPEGMVISNRILGLMLQNAEIRSLAASLSGTPALVTRRTVDDALNGFSLPPISFVYDTKVDVDGTTTAVIPDDRVILHGRDVGYTAWGISATSLELVNSNLAELAFENAPGIVGVVEKIGPPYRQFTYVDAVGMPVLENPKRLLVADVI